MVESDAGCIPLILSVDGHDLTIHNTPIQDLLDLTATNRDITSLVKVGISYTYLYFGGICDIF